MCFVFVRASALVKVVVVMCGQSGRRSRFRRRRFVMNKDITVGPEGFVTFLAAEAFLLCVVGPGVIEGVVVDFAELAADNGRSIVRVFFEPSENGPVSSRLVCSIHVCCSGDGG